MDPTPAADDAGHTTEQLTRVADRFASALGPGRLIEFPATRLDRVGVPVWATWWTGASGRGSSSTSGIGYGDTELRARVGALGECVEHVSSRQSLEGRPVEKASVREMRRRHGAEAVVDPRLLGLPAGSDFDDDRPLGWWPVHRVVTGHVTDEQLFAPAEHVASSRGDLPRAAPAGDWLITPVTNGLGAGGQLEQAISHGILEVLQRDGNGLTFRAMDPGVVLDLDDVRDPVTRAVLDKLADAGVEVMPKLASTDFGMANINVVGMAPDDEVLSATACGEAVHPDREVALRKALLEFASARARKQLMHGPIDAVRAVAPAAFTEQIELADPAEEEQRVLQAMVAWLRSPRGAWLEPLRRTVLSQNRTVGFSTLPTSTTVARDLLTDLCHRLDIEDHDILVADLSPGHLDGVHAAKVLIPGLEVETVAYGRIGERNVRRLVEAGRDDLVRVGNRPEGWHHVHLTEDAQDRLGGQAWLDRRALDSVAHSLLPLYREPGWHTAQAVLRSDASL